MANIEGGEVELRTSPIDVLKNPSKQASRKSMKSLKVPEPTDDLSDEMKFEL